MRASQSLASASVAHDARCRPGWTLAPGSRRRDGDDLSLSLSLSGSRPSPSTSRSRRLLRDAVSRRIFAGAARRRARAGERGGLGPLGAAGRHAVGGGLSVETMKAALEAAFAESADVLRVALPWRRDGLPPGVWRRLLVGGDEARRPVDPGRAPARGDAPRALPRARRRLRVRRRAAENCCGARRADIRRPLRDDVRARHVRAVRAGRRPRCARRRRRRPLGLRALDHDARTLYQRPQRRAALVDARAGVPPRRRRQHRRPSLPPPAQHRAARRELVRRQQAGDARAAPAAARRRQRARAVAYSTCERERGSSS